MAGKYRRAQERAERLEAERRRRRLHQTADGGPANKPVVRDEPGPLSVLTGEDPGQLTLPGLPRGFLAYQINAKRGTIDGGGWAGPGRRSSPAKRDPSLPPPS